VTSTTFSTTYSEPPPAIDRRVLTLLSMLVFLAMLAVHVGASSTRFGPLSIAMRMPLALGPLSIELLRRRLPKAAWATAGLLGALAVPVLVVGLATEQQPYASTNCPPTTSDPMCVEVHLPAVPIPPPR
jgi:hypothetical protein